MTSKSTLHASWSTLDWNRMSRPDHIVERFQKTMGARWWWRRYADLVDRRQPDGTITPRQKPEAKPADPPFPYPSMLPREPDMSRQVHRALYRKACKIAGVDYRGYGRPTPEEIAELEATMTREWDPVTGTLKINIG